MNITEIRVNLAPEEIKKKDGVLAFVSLTLGNELVVHDIKVMSNDGIIRLGMPSRKITAPCTSCHRRTSISDSYCSNCGNPVKPQPPVNKKRIHLDMVHPITDSFREKMESQILISYNRLVKPNEQLKMRN